MRSFLSFVSEARRAKIRQDSKTGDEDGVNARNDSVGTVSITDDLEPDSWNNSPADRMKAVKGLLKLGRVHGAVEMPHHSIKENLASAASTVRSTPVNIGSTPKVKATNAPSSASSLQAAADSRRAKLDTFAQRQTELSKKTAAVEVKRRQAAAKTADSSQSSKQPKQDGV